MFKNNMRYHILLFVLLLGFITTTLQAQLQVSGIPQTIPGAPTSYAAMLQALFGAGVQVSNVQIFADTAAFQAGWFQNTGGNLGLTEGMLLTSGDIQSAVGPNNSTGITGAVTTGPGDPDLNTLAAPQQTFDRCVIEFDIIPYCDSIKIQYVFGSDEYMVFVNSINDVFGFFLTGPNPSGGNYTSYNIARIPGLLTPISINNVNCNTNNQYYVCNQSGFSNGACPGNATCPLNNATTSIEYNGFTTVLNAYAAVVPCQAYHVKIGVADASDHVLDSGVFLQAGAVSCAGAILNINVGNTLGVGGNQAVEGCVDGFFTFNLPGPLAVNDTFNLIVGGTATPNVDYTGFLPTQIVFPAGQTSVTIPVPIINDGINEGIETVQLIYVDSTLCSSTVITDTIELVILDAPVTNAGPDHILCSGDTIQIGVLPSFGYVYSWSPSTGMINPNVSNPQITLTNNTTTPQIIDYVLSSTTAVGGCTATDTVRVTIAANVTADFTATTVCQGAATVFTNASSSSAASYEWDFANGGGASTQVNPSLIYAAANTYNVQLIATTAAGCKDTMVKPVIVNPNPIAAFTAPAVCFPLTSVFTDNTGTATAWAWNFGDGQFSGFQNPTHNYASAGSYQAQVIVANAQGCLDTATQTVVVHPQAIVDFVTNNVCFENAVSFTSGSNAFVTIEDWNFGDGNTSSSFNPTHNYANPNTYNVTLIGTTVNGCKDTVTKPVTVYPKPNAAFAAANQCLNTAVNFADLTGTAVAWNWSFGDGTTDIAQNPSHNYTLPNTYNVQLIVTTSDNCKDTVTQPVQVHALPVADFVTSGRCLVDSLKFLNTTVAGSGVLTNFAWNFGDASISGATNPSHLYGNPGTYNVTLIVSDGFNCRDTVVKPVDAYPLPVVSFVTQNTCEDASVGFTNTSTVPTGTITQSKWFFGDNTSVTQTSPSHIYNNSGVYNVSLIVTTDRNCVDTLTNPITVYPRPKASFEAPRACFGDTTYFTDLSFMPNIVANDLITQWNWDFAGTGVSNVQNPKYVFPISGDVLPVKLVAITSNGCKDSVVKNVFVVALPADPTLIADTACYSNSANLFAIPPFGSQTYWYNFPNDATPFQINSNLPINNLLYDQNYFVQSVTNIGKCKGNLIPLSALVYPQNQGYITISDSVAELPNAVLTFGTNSLIALETYSWNFDDKNTSTVAQPVHGYEFAGKYTVTLNAVDVNGCDLSLSRDIEIKEIFGITMPSAFSPNGDGYNDFYTIGNYQIANFSIQIYDRWGQIVFESTDGTFSWDGKHTKTGKDMPEGVYVYVVQGVSSTNKKVNKSGTITILR